MTPYTEKMISAIAAYEAKCGVTTPDAILESLWYDYACQNPVDEGRIRAAGERLRPVFEELSLTAYQRSAYLDGLRFGVHLIQELE